MLQEGSPENWGPTALPELCTPPPLGLEEWDEDKGNWVQSFVCFFLSNNHNYQKVWIPFYRWGKWLREVKELTWGPPRSGRARNWTHICLTSKPNDLFLWKGMNVKSHLLIPQIFSKHTSLAISSAFVTTLLVWCSSMPMQSFEVNNMNSSIHSLIE